LDFKYFPIRASLETTISAIGFYLKHFITEKIECTTYPGPPCIAKYTYIPLSDLKHLWGLSRFGAVRARRMAFWHNVIVTLYIKNTKDQVSRSNVGKGMNGQNCRFWPFGAVENKCLLAICELSMVENIKMVNRHLPNLLFSKNIRF